MLVALIWGERVGCGEPEGEVDTLVDAEILRVAPGLREAVLPLFKLPVGVALLDALPRGEREAVPVGESRAEAEAMGPVAEAQALLDTLGRRDTLALRDCRADAEAMEGEELSDAPREAVAPIPWEAVAGAVKRAVALPPLSPGPLLTVAAQCVDVGCAVAVPCPAVGVAGREGLGDWLVVSVDLGEAVPLTLPVERRSVVGVGAAPEAVIGLVGLVSCVTEAVDVAVPLTRGVALPALGDAVPNKTEGDTMPVGVPAAPQEGLGKRVREEEREASMGE